jgi:ribosomal-protein-alanine N-acetyltransferase
MHILKKPTSHRQSEFLAAVRKSKRLHGAWVAAPRTPKAFKAYLRRIRNKVHLGYWVLTKDGELAGVINVNEIVRGAFCSGYLGYYAFVPHNGKGYLTRGLAAVLTDLFRVHGLHRVEANIQPGNNDSQVLVQRLGFRLEGFSPRYLKIAGRWRDHERWALTVEDWRRKPARLDNKRLERTAEKRGRSAGGR